ncbi:MAG TPA: POTRA domain-containing protein [Thermoanaerobaculia bacterium]|nr:POTRA domain-containing protein [Thermoanaerobaculia bacterium]
MDSSRGHRRTPVVVHASRLTASGILGAALFCAPAQAQIPVSPDLLLWIWSQAQPASDPVLGARPDVAGAPAIPPGSVIGEVRVVTKPIFDPEKPGEDKAIFRLANRLHRTTRPGVIERQLTFQPGDVFSPELIAESARLLRTKDYLYDVDIRPTLREDGKVDVEVATRDVWTLEGSASFSRSGGENDTSFSIEDTNLFGTGKELTVARIGTVDRTSNLIRFRDTNVLGSHVQLLASYADNSDGGRVRFELEQPFYSLQSRWAAGVRLFRDERLERIFKLGKVASGFEHRNDSLEVYGGLSRGLVNGAARRWEAGFTYSQEDFARSEKFPKEVIPLPEDRTLAYPWVSYEYIEDRHIVERDLNRIQRSEDVNLGRQFRFRLGFSSPAFGAETDRVIIQGALSSGWRPSPRQLVLGQFGGSTRYGDGDAENLVAGGRVRYYARNFGEHLFYASLGADLARRLDGEEQLLLGGDSGLRGYPLRYQLGDRRVLLTLEQRFFSGVELFHLVHVGAAVFFDAGQAWFADSLSRRDSKLNQQERRILKDVGLGLRLGSSRSSRGAVLHLDIAYPLDRGRNIDSLQWLVSTSETF